MIGAQFICRADGFNSVKFHMRPVAQANFVFKGADRRTRGPSRKKPTRSAWRMALKISKRCQGVQITLGLQEIDFNFQSVKILIQAEQRIIASHCGRGNGSVEEAHLLFGFAQLGNQKGQLSRVVFVKQIHKQFELVLISGEVASEREVAGSGRGWRGKKS